MAQQDVDGLGMRWGQLLLMLLPREELKVTALARCSHHLANCGGLQVLAVMCLKEEAVKNNQNHGQGQSKISITNIQRNH